MNISSNAHFIYKQSVFVSLTAKLRLIISGTPIGDVERVEIVQNSQFFYVVSVNIPGINNFYCMSLSEFLDKFNSFYFLGRTMFIILLFMKLKCLHKRIILSFVSSFKSMFVIFIYVLFLFKLINRKHVCLYLFYSKSKHLLYQSEIRIAV